MGDDTATREDLTLGRDAFMNHIEGVLDPAYRLATVMLLDYGAAEDAVHDATVSAWRDYRRADGEVISFRTWFLAIVVRQCRAALRWRWLTIGRRRRGGGDLDRTEGLQEALGGLPLASRTALFCFVSLDLPMDEVARVLGTSLSRVRARVYRAGERVQAELDRDEEMEA
ncbi:MAG TPA: sigma-70 family RNA polymerase sigma factor [Candidatus Dormibacteraeota bacterium]|nr:sigma-70 family RNA polymerase sigma factor [Candidatus Dormibacteraeota bacterium]